MYLIEFGWKKADKITDKTVETQKIDYHESLERANRVVVAETTTNGKIDKQMEIEGNGMASG